MITNQVLDVVRGSDLLCGIRVCSPLSATHERRENIATTTAVWFCALLEASMGTDSTYTIE